jgi:hypothetical protein
MLAVLLAEESIMPDRLIVRVRSEYHEMPGLQLTIAQACRLWQIDEGTCRRVLAALQQERFLHQTASGAYAASPLSHRRRRRTQSQD